MQSMDKDKVIKDLNQINKQLAKKLDENESELQKIKKDSNKLASDIRTMCARDIISKK